MDGVIANSTVTVIEDMNQALGTNFTESDFTSWNWVYEKTLELTGDKKLADKLNSGFITNSVVSRAPVYPLAKFALKVIRSQGAKTFIITAKDERTSYVATQWLNHRLGWKIGKNYYHRQSTSQARTEEYKIKTAQDLQLDMFFDDFDETVRHFHHQNSPTKAYLVTQRWNHHAKDLNHVRVPFGWLGIIYLSLFTKA